MSTSEFFGYGMLAVIIAILIAYPFSMNFAHREALLVSRKVSHLCRAYPGYRPLGRRPAGPDGDSYRRLLGGFLSRFLGFNIGVQFMGYYTAVLTVPALLALGG